MRDNFSFNMLPIVQDNMNCIVSDVGGMRSLTSITSNGYYGYQPPPLQKKEQEPLEAHPPICEMEVQFESPPYNQMANRKRCRDFSNGFPEYKKRRQNDPCPFIHQQPPTALNRDVKLRTPTHNIPDMTRCLMDLLHVPSNAKKKTKDSDRDELLEELLKETHGCSVYHWIGGEL